MERPEATDLELRHEKTAANIAAFKRQWRFLRLLLFLILISVACGIFYVAGEVKEHIACLRN